MDLFLRGYTEFGENVVTIGEEDTVDSEYVGMIIKEDYVPTGYAEDNCFLHIVMVALTIAFVVYNIVRVVQRSKDIQSKTNSVTETI